VQPAVVRLLAPDGPGVPHVLGDPAALDDGHRHRGVVHPHRPVAGVLEGRLLRGVGGEPVRREHRAAAVVLEHGDRTIPVVVVVASGSSSATLVASGFSESTSAPVLSTASRTRRTCVSVGEATTTRSGAGTAARASDRVPKTGTPSTPAAGSTPPT